MKSMPLKQWITKVTNAIKALQQVHPMEWFPTLATGDYNNLTVNGFYYSQNGMTAHLPVTGSHYCYIIVLSYLPYMTVQFSIYSSGKVYMRNLSGAPKTWGAWREL